MATNKHAQIRYQALDRCFQNNRRRYFIEDLVEACNNAIHDYTGILDGVRKRQVQSDIAFMESEAGWSVVIDRIRDGRRVFYRYSDPSFSINKQPLSEAEVGQLKEVIYMLNRFKGIPQFEWMEEILARFESEFKLRGNITNVVEFEQNPYLKGLNYFSIIFNAIINNQTLNLTYQRFGQKSKKYVFYPYFLKQYNNRWFVFGMCDHLKDKRYITSLALDRVEKMFIDSTPYIGNNDIDFNEYFEDVIGVSIHNKEIEPIILEIDNVLYPYVETKPLHGSQRVIKRGEQVITIELKLRVNYELENLLLGYIDKIRIVSPNHLKEKMLSRLSEAMERNY